MTPHPIMTDRRIHNQRLNIDEFQRRETVLDSSPLALFIELTQNCNLSCPSCRSANAFQRDWNMTPAVFDALAEETFHDALIVDLRGWGESLVLKDFDHYARRVLDAGPRLRIVTNGQINKRDLWPEMMAADSLVVVSCDAASAELFSVLRAGGTLERLKATVSALVSARDDHGTDAHAVSLYTVVSAPNLPELPQIVELADTLGVRRLTFAPIQIDLDHAWNLRSHLDEVRHSLAAAEERARQLDVDLQLASSLDVSFNLDEHVKSMCMHPWGFAYISYEGRVGFCDHLIGQPEFTFGSLAQESFRDIWNSRRWQELRTAHQDGELAGSFDPCKWCYKQRYVDFENLVHPAYADHRVSTHRLPHLTGESVTEAPDESFLGDRQDVTAASHKLLPLTVMK